VAPGEEVVEDGVPAPRSSCRPAPDHTPGAGDETHHPTRPCTTLSSAPDAPSDQLIHHEHTFGTPEQDAFRRDFTINALFYDISTFAVIDYVDGLADLRAGIVRAIGDPEVRFRKIRSG